jgi:hypothetical protein
MAALQIRRGLAADRTTITPANGELIYTTDTKLVYVGDGTTLGGNLVGSQASGSVTSVDISGGSTGLTATGGPVTSSGTITLGGTLAVVNGGTGATTAGDARSNLSAAASGANSDITSLTGLTTALSLAQGGTGATTASNARSNLSAAASGANSDITSLTGLTTALSVAQGGTGATDAAGARSSLGAVNIAGDTMTGALILNADPTVALGAATKQYVDNAASGLNVHAACVAATTAGLEATYDNGTSGVGATLTGTGALPTIDTVTLSANDRVLVKNQTPSAQNGIYVVTQTTANWVLTRASDFDNSPAGEVVAGDSTYIQQGSQAGTQWVMTTAGTITIGTTNMSWTQFGGPGSYTAGTGISIDSNVISNTGVTSLSAGSNSVSVSASTGAVTVDLTANTITNLLPSQSGNPGKFLSTDGSGLLSWSAVDAFPSQTGNAGEILTTNGTTTSWSSLGVTQVIYVSKGGNDTTADGSITKPFLTIGAAMTYINATFPQGSNSGAQIVIMLAPGNYVENVTINRFLTQIWGYEGKSKATRISGTVTVQGTTDHSGVFQNVVTLSNLFIAASSTNSAVVLSGTISTSLEINNCSLYTDGTGSPLLINNTAAGGNRLRVPYCEIVATGNAPAVDISNVNNGAIGNINSSSASTSDAWKFTNASCTIGVLQLTTSTATNVLTLAGTSTLSVGYSAFTSTKANGNGVSVSSTSTFIATGCAFNIPLGTGYTVYGAAGSVYIRGGNYSVYGTNSTTGPTLTALNMPGVVAATDISGTVAVTNGGTGSSNATTARSNLSAAKSGANSDITSLTGLTTALSATQGGTAQTTYATGDILYASSANTLSKLTIGTSGQVLTVSGGVPSWAASGAAAAGTLTGTTLASNVVSSSLTSVGTLSSLSISGTTTFGTAYTETNTAVTSAASTTIDCATSNNFAVDLSTSITTLSFSNVPASGRQYSATLFLTQGGGGSKTINWPGSVKWPSATAPTLTTTNGKADIIVLTTYDGGTSWFGMVAGQNF